MSHRAHSACKHRASRVPLMLHGGEGGERCVGVSAFMMLLGGKEESSSRGREGSRSFRFRISRGNIYTTEWLIQYSCSGYLLME